MATKTTVNSLVLLQKGIIRTIAQVSFHEHTTPIFKQLNVLKITNIYNLECLKFIQCQMQHNHNLFVFPRATDTHNINTQNRHNLRPPFPKTESQKRFVTYFGVTNWNELPENIKYIANKQKF